jgi:hypothetical protein
MRCLRCGFVVTAVACALAQIPSAHAEAQSAAPLPTNAESYHFAAELNPLDAALTLFGATFELLPANHHAIDLTPSYWLQFGRLMGELGYRYYFGDGGPRGVFLGASTFGAYFKCHYAHNGPRPLTNADASIVGVAVDGGYQEIVSGWVIGGGLGVGYQWSHKPYDNCQVADPERSVDWPPDPTSYSLFPRFLFSVGRAF